ncbi:MAG: type II toxin-antitoxin system Y4mF family antitoxin [Flavobacteriaceae bacterium]|nr:type II toxin-antitoxin system Y4mF family antitoxin [Flavobacteriaceae bacterium]
MNVRRQLSEFVKQRRKEVNLTQEEFAERTGVALTVIRKIEQGKTNLNMDKVNLVLQMFGHELAPVKSKDLNQ